MSTTTLLVVIGFGVLVKTSLFIGFAVRRDRRHRAALAAAGAEPRRATADGAASGPTQPDERRPSGWRLLWAEPGVLLVENTDDAESARDVELVATLTTSTGLSGSLTQVERFVGTGACFEARFVELESALLAELGGGADEVRGRLASTLDYALTWRTAGGDTRREARAGELVVPVPDLALELV